MSLLAQVDVFAAELYVLRFVVRTNKHNMLFCAPKYAPILDLAQFDWTYGSTGRLLLATESQEITNLTSAHFNLIQYNASGWSQLFVWFPPVRYPAADEVRLMQRAGVQI